MHLCPLMLFGYTFRTAYDTVKWIGHLLLRPVGTRMSHVRVCLFSGRLTALPSSTCNQPPMDKQTINVAGLSVNVFSLFSGIVLRRLECPCVEEALANHDILEDIASKHFALATTCAKREDFAATDVRA